MFSALQMGYAMPTQINHGIHLRQFSRAFIIADSQKQSRVVFVNVDICMGTQIMKMQASINQDVSSSHLSSYHFTGDRQAEGYLR